MSLIKAEHINDYKLSLTFSDGSSKVIDFEEKLKSHAIYKPYLNIKKFLTYKVDHGALRWPGNILDYHYTQLIKMWSHIKPPSFPTSASPSPSSGQQSGHISSPFSY